MKRLRPLSARDLYRCCSHPGLAILRRASTADNRDQRPKTWLVAGSQANHRGLGRAPRLDEAVGRSRNRCCSTVRAGDASGNGWADRARESAHSLDRPGAGTSDSGGSRRAGANRGPARRQSRPDGAPDRYATDLEPGNPCLQPGNPCQNTSSSSAATHCCRSAQAHASVAAVIAGINTAASPVIRDAFSAGIEARGRSARRQALRNRSAASPRSPQSAAPHL